jgi:hypothetical protein
VRLQKNELGTRVVNAAGYVLIRVGVREWHADRGGWALEHRYAVAKKLGRPLLRYENVHHVDGNKTNNDLENLELWTTSQPSGQRVADKLEWARKFVALYGDKF